MSGARGPYEVAFVLGGGGILGAHEVGMLRALAESSIDADVILGTSVGAINGALFAADPTVAGVERLSELWADSNFAELLTGSVLRRVATLARTGTHLQSLTEVRARLVEGERTFRQRLSPHRQDHAPLRRGAPPMIGCSQELTCVRQAQTRPRRRGSSVMLGITPISFPQAA